MTLPIELPDVLHTVILSAWLTIKDVARLDSSFCSNEHRQDLLSIAYGRHAVLQWPVKVSVYSAMCDRFQAWVLRKDACVSGFFVTPELVNRYFERWKEHLQRHGCLIQWVECSCVLSEESTARSAESIAAHCPKLTKFTAVCDVTVYDIIAEHCPLLEELSIPPYRHHTPRAVAAITRFSANLRWLEVDCGQLDVELLIELVKRNTKLVFVNMLGVSEGDRLMSALAQHCRSLEEVIFATASLVLETIHFLLGQCTGLHTLHFVGCCVTTRVRQMAINPCPAMRNLTIEGTRITYYCRNTLLTACPGLTDLDLESCGDSENEVPPDIPLVKAYWPEDMCNPQLERVVLWDDGNVMGNDVLVCLGAHCENLREPIVPYIPFVSSIGVSAVVRQCLKLEKLDICSCRSVTDDALFEVARYGRSLKALSPSACRGITEAGVQTVMRSALTALNADDCDQLPESLIRRKSALQTCLVLLSVGKD